jgi:hypothetical protein
MASASNTGTPSKATTLGFICNPMPLGLIITTKPSDSPALIARKRLGNGMTAATTSPQRKYHGWTEGPSNTTDVNATASRNHADQVRA